MKIVDDIDSKFGWLIFPWVGSADVDAEAHRLMRIDVKDEAAVKDLIERDLVPWFKGELGNRREDALMALQYAVNAPAAEVEQMFDGDLVALVYDADDAKRIVCLIRDVFQAHQIHLPSE